MPASADIGDVVWRPIPEDLNECVIIVMVPENLEQINLERSWHR